MRECNFKYESILAKKVKRDVIPLFTNKVHKTIHEVLNNINDLTSGGARVFRDVRSQL
jgi:hypothetical protein